MKIQVYKVQGRGMYVEVKNRDGSLFMTSPLDFKLPQEPFYLVGDENSCTIEKHEKWQQKCYDKISVYMHQKFTKELYGDIEVIVGGLEPEVSDGL